MIPTSESYDSIAVAYRFFNERLFDGVLPDALLSYDRGKHLGFMASQRWIRVDGEERKLAHELAMNSAYFATRPLESTLSTLIHEQCHIWQFEHGKPGRRGYHTREFADIMEARGLICSDTGAPGGKRTGQRMTHYFRYGGPSWLAVRELIDEHDFTLPWVDRWSQRSQERYIRLYDEQERLVGPDGTPISTVTYPSAAPTTPSITITLPAGGDDDDEDGSEISVSAIPSDPLPSSAPGALIDDELIEQRKAQKKAKNDSKSAHICTKEGCKTKIWGKVGIQVGCFCGGGGGEFVLEREYKPSS